MKLENYFCLDEWVKHFHQKITFVSSVVSSSDDTCSSALLLDLFDCSRLGDLNLKLVLLFFLFVSFFLFLNVIFDCIIEEFACKELLIWATLMK